MDMGKLKEKITLYKDHTGTSMGYVEIYEHGTKIEADGARYICPENYVESVVAERELGLGKVQAHMVFHEVMGMKNDIRFIISGVQLPTLQKLCRKQ